MSRTQQTFLSYLCVFIVTLNDELKKVIVCAQTDLQMSGMLIYMSDMWQRRVSVTS